MAAEILVLPGVERRDLAGEPVPAAEVLQAAINNGVTSVAIVGLDRSGNLYVAASNPDTDRNVGMLMRAVSLLSSVTIVNDVVIGGDSA